MGTKTVNDCATCPYRGRHIYVIGRFRFERELMANFIGTHTAAKWFEAEHLGDIPVSNQGAPLGQKLLLFDTHGQSRDNLGQLFASSTWRLHAHNLLALFNLQHDLEIEKEALRQGVHGFLYDDDSAQDLVQGICAINSGELWISRRIMAECLTESYIGRERPEPEENPLSEREIEILRFLSTGVTNDSIADQMCISPHTVKSHLHNIFHKIEVGNRLQAVLWAKNNL